MGTYAKYEVLRQDYHRHEEHCSPEKWIVHRKYALGYDPATGVISYEGDPNKQNTNHLMTIMGGFEIMNEMQEMIQVPEFNKVWLEHARDYKQKALEITHNRFRVCRLMAYAASICMTRKQPQRPGKIYGANWNILRHRNSR